MEKKRKKCRRLFPGNRDVNKGRMQKLGFQREMLLSYQGPSRGWPGDWRQEHRGKRLGN